MGLFYNDNTHGPRNPHGASTDRVEVYNALHIMYQFVVAQQPLVVVLHNSGVVASRARHTVVRHDSL